MNSERHKSEFPEHTDMLAVFDNDGTICDTQDVEGRCYALAIERVTGMSLSTLDWTAYDEPTRSGIVRELLAGDAEAKEKEERIKFEFCRLLQEERPKFPGDFLPIEGAVEFIERLVTERICAVAVATGCFDTTARFKLECCGVALNQFPHATSSDVCRRSDIIPLAAARAGFDPSSVVYFGDAPWDVRVCTMLGIPMIGIGRRYNLLRTLGVRRAFRDYSDPGKIIDALLELRPPDNALQATLDNAPESGSSTGLKPVHRTAKRFPNKAQGQRSATLGKRAPVFHGNPEGVP